MLNNHEKELLLETFPNIELSYETIVHKKVYNHSLILFIPEGKKCFAWFTFFNNQNICFIMELNENNQISNIRIVYCCFDEKLSFGTIFYGTYFTYNKTQFFTAEDLKYYKGKNIDNISYLDK